MLLGLVWGTVSLVRVWRWCCRLVIADIVDWACVAAMCDADLHRGAASDADAPDVQVVDVYRRAVGVVGWTVGLIERIGAGRGYAGLGASRAGARRRRRLTLMWMKRRAWSH